MAHMSKTERLIRQTAPEDMPISSDLISIIRCRANKIKRLVVRQLVEVSIEQHQKNNARRKQLGIYTKKTLSTEDIPKDYTDIDLLHDARRNDVQEDNREDDQEQIEHTPKVNAYA